MRKLDKKKRAVAPFKLSPELREYLAFIGGRGGEKSRRYLSPTHAKQMVAIREAKRRALKQGRLEWALKRVKLPKEKPISYYQRPSVRPHRLIGPIGADTV
jgi:hypothetical protein